MVEPPLSTLGAPRILTTSPESLFRPSRSTNADRARCCRNFSHSFASLRWVEERTRERVPLDWAATQLNLGTAFLRLGERESGTARLKEAVAAFREALKEQTRERAPLQWAMTQHNLGAALESLGERESGTARLEEAVAAYRAALKVQTRERAPLQWAMTQHNLSKVSESGRAARRVWRRRSRPIAPRWRN
jgi:tetratricopeptide (TPR) repeat protein